MPVVLLPVVPVVPVVLVVLVLVLGVVVVLVDACTQFAVGALTHVPLLVSEYPSEHRVQRVLLEQISQLSSVQLVPSLQVPLELGIIVFWHPVQVFGVVAVTYEQPETGIEVHTLLVR